MTEACVEEAGDNCAAAEVFIVPSVVAGPSGSADLAAYVRPTLETIDRNPILTSGRAVDGLGLRSATLTVRAEPTLCWYLDAAFCYYFHQWEASGFDAIMFARGEWR